MFAQCNLKHAVNLKKKVSKTHLSRTQVNIFHYNIIVCLLAVTTDKFGGAALERRAFRSTVCGLTKAAAFAVSLKLTKFSTTLTSRPRRTGRSRGKQACRRKLPKYFYVLSARVLRWRSSYLQETVSL